MDIHAAQVSAVVEGRSAEPAKMIESDQLFGDG